MNIFDELYFLYRIIDNNLTMIETQARINADAILEQQTVRQRELNDQAYFLYMFTRLEEKIRSLTTTLIDLKTTTTTDPKDLRAWEIIKGNKNLSLMQHTTFLTSNGGTDYNIIYDFKKQRDQIAHGGLVSSIIISYVYTEMARLYNTL